MPFLDGIEYQEQDGIIAFVKCPLVEDWIENIDCIVSADVANGLLKETCISKVYTQKENWREICKTCSFSEY